jgi:hypothetical protein
MIQESAVHKQTKELAVALWGGKEDEYAIEIVPHPDGRFCACLYGPSQPDPLEYSQPYHDKTLALTCLLDRVQEDFDEQLGSFVDEPWEEGLDYDDLLDLDENTWPDPYDWWYDMTHDDSPYPDDEEDVA